MKRQLWQCPRCGRRFADFGLPGQLMLCGCGTGATFRGGVMTFGQVTAMELVDEDADLFDCGDYKLRVVPSWAGS